MVHSETISPAETKKPVILVVDDEPLLRINAVGMFEDAGCETVEADGAEDALTQLGRHPEVSVLFTDINMPGRFDGLELARRVHKQRPDIQLIITSGRAPPARTDIPDDGRFIAKPYDAQSLVSVLEAFGK